MQDFVGHRVELNILDDSPERFAVNRNLRDFEVRCINQILNVNRVNGEVNQIFTSVRNAWNVTLLAQCFCASLTHIGERLSCKSYRFHDFIDFVFFCIPMIRVLNTHLALKRHAKIGIPGQKEKIDWLKS